MRLRLIVAGAAALAVLTASCGDDTDDADEPATTAAEGGDAASDDDGEVPVVRMGWGLAGDEVKHVMMNDPTVAANMGTCYDVEWTRLAATSEAVQAMVAGTLDAGTVGSLTIANAIEQDAEVIVTGGVLTESSDQFSTTWMVKSDSGIDSLDDLEGKIVGTSGIANPTNYLQDFHIEAETGLVAGDDYQVVEVPYPQQEEALASGQIDLGIFAQPFFSKADATGQFTPVFSVVDIADADPFVILVEAFRKEFVEANPEAVKCWLEDYAATYDYIYDPANKEAVVAIEAELTGAPPQALGYLFGDNDYLRPERGALDVEGLQQAWDFFLERGGIASELKVEDYIDEEFMAG